MNTSHQELLRTLPPVGELIEDERLSGLVAESGRDAVVEWTRVSLDDARAWLLSTATDDDDVSRESLGELVIAGVIRQFELAGLRRFERVVNATGVVLHTGLGRSPLSAALLFVGAYVLGIGAALFSALCLKKTILKGEAVPLVIELPPYLVRVLPRKSPRECLPS